MRAHKTTPLFSIHVAITLVHNFAASVIKESNPGLTDSEVFFAAREFNQWLVQKLIYNNLLPTLLGEDATAMFDLTSTESCYNASNTLQVPVEVIVVALRYCHAYIPGEYKLVDPNGNVIETRNLHDKLSTDALAQFFDDVIRGLLDTEVHKQQSYCPSSYGQSPPKDYKDDLRALDIQAARDACVEPYLQYLRNLMPGLSVTGDWSDYRRFFDEKTLKVLSYLYKMPQELELAVGGALENRDQSLFGNLFKIFLGTFFKDLKCNDSSFWTHALNDGMFRDYDISR